MSTKGKEYKLAIRIAGVIDKSFTTSLATANTSLKATLTAMDKDFTNLDKGFDKIMGAGKKCFSALATAAGVATMAIGAATAASIAVGSEFESAFAGVKKTVDATEAEYAKLRQDILDMSNIMPSSAVAIACVMEVAGQLGIAKESLTDFTETMINLGVSTNLSAEEAATSLAKFTNITQMDDYGKDGISNFERLGSVVVDLGNNFATTEADIVAMATNLAASGAMAGLTEAQIMAISAAMSSVGIAAEAGGSSMSRVLMQMQQAVADGSDDMAIYAKTAGLTAKEFETLFREDAGEALTLFIEGLNDAGEDSYGILKDLDLSTIRVRKALLSLAGAEGLLGETMDLANEAWDENTALAIEAGKRYETVESKTQILLNNLKELGIVAYDELREPFVDTIDTISDKVQGFTEYVGGPNGISEWLDNIGTELPTLQRKFKKYGEPVFDGIVGAGKWIVKNKNGLISTFAGIGASLAAYKTASTLTHVVKALMTLGSMNPATLGILGVVAAIGGITAAYAAYKQYEEELKNSSLEKHFGNIALSMEDIQKVAEHIVSSDSLGGVKEALAAFSDLDTISATMENSIEEINKMNWKVSIGMELTETEQEQYKTAIQEYVSAAQEYALQSQYAVSLNLSLGTGEKGADLVSKVNQFYQASYDEMTSLGQDLSAAVNDAFANGVLDPKEIDAIANLQAKMAEVQQSLATGEFDATLSMLGMDYANGAGLDADSFANLQEELNKQIAAASEVYKESYTKNYAALSASHDSGYLKDAEFSEALALLQDEYLKNIADLNIKSAAFQVDTVMSAYSEELKGNIESIQESIGTEIEELMSKGYTSAQDWGYGLYNALYDVESGVDLSKDDKLALGELYAGLQTQLTQLKDLAAEYDAAGQEVPAAISEAISNIYAIGAVSGDESALWEMFGAQLSDNEEYATVIALAQEVGSSIPVEIMEAMTDEGVMIQIDENVDYILESVRTGLAEGVEITIPVYYDLAAYGIKSKNAGILSSDININSFSSSSELDKYINHRATGGLATRPELTWFAENGPEMAIPIDGSRNAISLWERTGRLLGMDSVLDGLSLDGGSGPAIEYSPTLQFYGEAPSKDDLTDALRISQDEFDSLMDRYFKTRGRLAFG